MKNFNFTVLKALREQRHFTQEQMGKLLYMTQSNYCKIERGQKKIDSLQTFKTLAKALEVPLDRLFGILSGEKNIQSSGMPMLELWQVEQLLKDEPLRKDEFVFFSTEVLEPEKYDFKAQYSGLNIKELDVSESFPYIEYPPVMNIIVGNDIGIGFEYENQEPKTVSVWLGDKKLGIIPEQEMDLVECLITELMISRVVLIENTDAIPGYFDTYMKAVFVATNAINKKASYEKGRFTRIEFMSGEEVEKVNNEAFLAQLEHKRRKM